MNQPREKKSYLLLVTCYSSSSGLRMSYSSSKHMHWYVTCIFERETDWINCMNATKIGEVNDDIYLIKCIVSACKEKACTMYMETERGLPVEMLHNFFKVAGAGSFDWVLLNEDWELQSSVVLSDIRNSSVKKGFKKIFVGHPFSGATPGEPEKRYSYRPHPNMTVQKSWDMLSYFYTDQR